MKKIIRLTESDLSRIVRRVIKEQEVGGFKEGPGDSQSKEFDHYNKIVKPNLLKSGFKDEYDKNLERFGKENSLNYGGHNNGVNVLWDRIKGIYHVWVGNNKGMKEFALGSNDPKLVANKVVQYALSLKR
jgi:hypothetical protein